MTFDLGLIFKESYYMIAVFNEKGDLEYSNKKFNMYFPNVKNKSSFDDIKVSEEIYSPKRKGMSVESPDMDGIVKFEINFQNGFSSYMGQKLNYDMIISLGEAAGISSYSKEKKQVGATIARNKMNAYCTLMLSRELNIKYVTENIYEILGENKYLGKNLEEIFNTEVADEIKSRIKLLRIFEDTTLDIDGKLIALSQLSSGYIVLNIYPYSSNVMNKFEEISHLKYKIKKLEAELSAREKFIKAQKEIFRNMATVDGLTKLYNRRYLIEKYTDEVEKSSLYGYKFAMTSIHIDNFKKVNLDLGYEKADEMLKKLSILIRKNLDYKKDLAFRTSSADFVILSSPSTDGQARERFTEIKSEFEKETGLTLTMKVVDSDTTVDGISKSEFMWMDITK